MDRSLKSKVANASKWSIVTELAAKLITPVLNMILARLLEPEAFGVLTTVTMVIAFAEVFVESGFSKYLIQHNFESPVQERQYMSVAFWINISLSIILWGLIALFNDQLASLVGNPGMGHLLVVSGVSIPLYSIVGIECCKLKKDLNFKKLFSVRITSALVPLFVTVPLALLKFDYWALIIGNIAGIAVQAVLLMFIGNFKPQFFFSKAAFSEMFSFGIWTLLNGLAVWVTNWIDSLLIGRYMNDYYLGLYKNSTGMITSLFGMVTAAIVPVLFSSLSKMQNDDDAFSEMYQNTVKNITMFVLPMGVGVCIFSDLATYVLFGSKWVEATSIVAISAITTALRTVFISINGDVYRAKGHFKTPFILQLLDISITIPACYFALMDGFWTFVYVRAISRLLFIVPEQCIIWKQCSINPKITFKKLVPVLTSTLIMGMIAFALHKLCNSLITQVISIILCVIIYFASLCIYRTERIFICSLSTPMNRKKRFGHEN